MESDISSADLSFRDAGSSIKAPVAQGTPKMNKEIEVARPAPVPVAMMAPPITIGNRGQVSIVPD